MRWVQRLFGQRGAARRGWSAAPLGLVLGALGCSEPELTSLRFRCESNADCVAGHVCGSEDGVRVCLPAGEQPIRLGMSGPFRGAEAALGIELRRGILASLNQTNQTGGLFGRQLLLASLNDDYDPAQAVANTLKFLDVRASGIGAGPDERGSNSVFGLLGHVGTTTTLSTAPLANKNRVLMFAAMTGAHEYFRDGTLPPFVYNYRPGFYEEAETLIEYLAFSRQPRVISDPPGDSYRRLIVFSQNDAYGEAGYAGLVDAYNRRIGALPQPDVTQANPSIVRATYEVDDRGSVDAAAARVQQSLQTLVDEGVGRRSVAIVMMDTYEPGNQFTRTIKDWLNQVSERAQRLDLVFYHFSLAGAEALAAALTSPPATHADATDPSGQRRLAYADGVVVNQVVPSSASEASGVARYRDAIERLDNGALGASSFEGYLSAELLTAVLRRNGPDLEASHLAETLEHQMTSVDLGIGLPLGFSPSDHQASHTLWVSVIRADGSIEVPSVWTRAEGIRAN
jgi:ABC-type branched-subunit amino acid transport system substrate-binding protein